MDCLGHPDFYQPPLYPHFRDSIEAESYMAGTWRQQTGRVDKIVGEVVEWLHKPTTRPPAFSIKDPFQSQEVSLLKLVMSNPVIDWSPHIGVLTDSLRHVVREGGLAGAGKMSPWAKLYEALAVRLPCSPEIQEAAEILWDHGNVDCRFKAVVLLGYTRLRDAPSFLLDVFERDPVLNIRTNAVWSITKIGWSNARIISTLRDYYDRELFRQVIATNLFRFTGEWEYIDYIANSLEDPHCEKTTRLLDFLEPWPRYMCENGECGHPVFFKESWWQVKAQDPNASFYQTYTDWVNGCAHVATCWSCFQNAHQCER